MKRVGIDSLSFYVPSLFVSIEQLAAERNIEFAKLNKGLGLNKMAFPDRNEDAASFAANALFDLIEQNDINPTEIGRVYLGTESSLDGSKPTCTYAIEAVEYKLKDKYGERCFKNCDVLDMTFACIGAVDALQNSLDWVRNGSNRKAVVIASDLAKYDLYSTGEYTQGAGAVAMMVTEDPDILSITDNWGVAFNSVGDFFKPRRTFNKLEVLKQTARKLGKEISDDEAMELCNNDNSTFWSDPNAYFELYKDEPVYDGPYSNECYQDRINEALSHFKSQKDINVIEDWQHLVFHLPYAFQGRRMIVKNWVEWLKESYAIQELYEEIGKPDESELSAWYKTASKSKLYRSFVEMKIADGEKASSEIGNMYTASIFMSLLSILNKSFDDQIDITGNTIGFFSYGSGSKSKIFEGTIQENWKKKIEKSQLFQTLDSRSEIDIQSYEMLHKNQLNEPISKIDGIQLSSIGKEAAKLGLREYM
ncbi:MAG: hydroxymethylglutaryl-CoA synthase family protein [Chitinophagales bacterium]|nr:hydroxymethylglutaryl-CoA synthase family protein [Chitinophagales bacterium]